MDYSQHWMPYAMCTHIVFCLQVWWSEWTLAMCHYLHAPYSTYYWGPFKLTCKHWQKPHPPSLTMTSPESVFSCFPLYSAVCKGVTSNCELYKKQTLASKYTHIHLYMYVHKHIDDPRGDGNLRFQWMYLHGGSCMQERERPRER